MQTRFKYHIDTTPGQKYRLAKLVSCVRVFWNDSLSFEIIRENQTIVLEDLNVSGLVKNRKLSRAISDVRMEKIPNIFREKSRKILS